MKKIILFLFMFLPLYVNATIYDYYIEGTVLNNGDIRVREMFSLKGDEYNGFEREFKYGDTIYTGDDIEIVSIKGINSIDGFESFDSAGDIFSLNNNADKGDYGYYTVSNTYDGKVVRIYNYYKKNKDFYIEYIVKNVAIKHNDIGEVAYTLFTSLREDVSNIKIKFLVPNNKNIIRVWNHGPLTGENSIVSNEEVVASVPYLNAYEALDIRIVFDKSVLVSSKKTDSNNALNSIVNEETEKADKANKEREEARIKLEQLKIEIEEAIDVFEKDRTQKNKDYALYLVDKLYGYPEYDEYMNRLNSMLSYEEEAKLKRDKIIGNVISGLCVIYLGYGIYLLIKFYNKHDKEYKSSFTGEYYRDFPNTYGPEIVEYLTSKSVTSNSFSASLLNLIYKKNIGYEVIDKKNYKLKVVSRDNLTDSESKLIDCIFGSKEEITLKELKKNAKNDYNSFRTKYDAWNRSVIKDGESKNFFEKSSKGLYILYSLLPIILVFMSYYFEYINSFLILIVFTFMVISFVYYVAASKRTKEGNEDYSKWIGLKNYMKDFGRMHEKELPEIILWEKYLVYATIFGLAKKLAKDMEIKVKEFSDIDSTDIIRFNMINNMINVSNTVGTTISAVKRTADNAYAAAHSSNSSGGGFGGGFSSGGGSFGGGGGGGRF